MTELEARIGTRDTERADSLCLGSEISLARGQATEARALADRALSMLASVDVVPAPLEILCRQALAKAQLASRHPEEALAEMASAITRLRTTNPKARVAMTGLLLQRSRIELAAGNPADAAKSLAEARRLGANPEWLSPADREAVLAR
jgi:ATP/maltotriose-dependent transcriptional regulator MalT